MSDIDESTPPQTPEGSASVPPAGAAPATPSPEGEADQHDDAAQRRIAELSKENANHRRRLRELEATVAEHEREQMSEADRLRAEAAEAKAALEQERAERIRDRLRADVLSEAAKQRAVDPDAVYALLRDDLDAAGVDANVADLVKAKLKAKPYLVARPSTGSDADPARSHASDRPETDDQMRARLRGDGAAAFFDPKRAAERGGGVRFRTPT